MRVIKITPTGNIGNQMFQYMFAKMLHARVPDACVTGYSMDMWSLHSPADGPLPADTVTITGGHRHDVPHLIDHLSGGPDRLVDYGGYGQRLEYYGPARFMSGLFTPPESLDVPIFGDDCLLINVRGGEILRAIHGDYTPVPVSFYTKLINDTGLRPVFMGQIRDDFYSNALRSAFPDATFLTSMGPLADFETIRRATHVVISVSSFSWLAAWLSEAKTIHRPVLGFFHPVQRKDINLLPVDDPRYRFHQFPIRLWTGSEADLKFVLGDHWIGTTL
jgi:hypothetical protein